MAELTQEARDEIAAVYLETKNQIETAKRLHHSITTVSKYLKEYGLNCGRGGNQEAQIKATDVELIEAAKTMTLKEIAVRYQMHPQSLPRRFKRLGVWPVGYGDKTESIEKLIQYNKTHKHRPPQNPPPQTVRKFGDCWHFIRTQRDKYEKSHPDFEYLETRTIGSSRRIRMRCRHCGNVVERADATVRRKNIICEVCKQREQQQNETQEARVAMTRFFCALAEKRKPKTCLICGEVFYSEYPEKKYCSSKCSKRKSSYRGRCKKYGVYYDPSVTRIKVVKRDHGICQICGKICNPKDTRWGNSGPDFPTLDHIVALKNGGTHTWSNVQCACGLCNSNKRDLDVYAAEVS